MSYIYPPAWLFEMKILKLIEYSCGLGPIKCIQISHVPYLDIGGSSVLIKILLFLPYLEKTFLSTVFRNENNNTVSRNLHTGP